MNQNIIRSIIVTFYMQEMYMQLIYLNILQFQKKSLLPTFDTYHGGQKHLRKVKWSGCVLYGPDQGKILQEGGGIA